MDNTFTKFSELKYERPDFKELKKSYKTFIKRAKNAKNYEEFRQTILDSQTTMEDFETAFVLLNIKKDMDTSNDFYQKELKTLMTKLMGLLSLQKQNTKIMKTTPYRQDFEKEFGDLYYKQLAVEEKSEKMVAAIMSIKEKALVDKYSKIVATCSVDFEGQRCNFYGLLKFMESPDRNIRKRAFLEWAKLYEGVAESLDDIYNQLIKLRIKTAKKLKYPDYITMTYENRYRFDYNRDDVAAFRNNVLKYITPACAKLYEEQRARLGVEELMFYDEALVFPEGNIDPIGNKDDMVAAAKEMYRELSKETGEFFDFMCEHEMFDLETRPNKRLGGYCTRLSKYCAPFIFSNFNGTSADVDVLTHEAGHAFQAFTAFKTQILSSNRSSTSEINEIHSMSMEHFTYPWMDKFFGEKKDKYIYAHLLKSLTTIPYLVCVDEFQHVVFDNPTMSAEKRYEAWHEIEQKYMPWRKYDGNAFLEKGGFWMQKQHIFMYPFYYIDYALAQIGAFSFYKQSIEDSKKAFANYYDLCKMGGSLGYFDLLKHAGLANPLQEATVKDALEFVLDQLEKLAK